MGLLKNLFGNGKQLDGVSVALVRNRKVLLLKRLNFPFILNPGIWTFVQGSRDKGESYDATAYREVFEETRIPKEMLTPLAKPRMVSLYDLRNPERKWRNMFYIFEAKNQKVRINYESSGYRWATLDEIRNGTDYTNIFTDEGRVLRMLSHAVAYVLQDAGKLP